MDGSTWYFVSCYILVWSFMLYHHDPHQWTWGQGHGELWNLKLKFLVKVTFLLWKQHRQIVGRTSVSLVTLTCGSWSEGQHDLYFTVQWFSLISWLFDVWTSYFGIMSQYDPLCDLKINVPVGHCDLYFMVQWFLPYILKTVWCMNFILQDYESVWPDIWPKINVDHCDLYFMVQWFCLMIYEHNTLGLWVSMTRYLTSKYLSDTVSYISWCSDYALYLENYSVAEHQTLGLHLTSEYFMVHWIYLEDCLMYEQHTFGLWFSMTWHLTS